MVDDKLPEPDTRHEAHSGDLTRKLSEFPPNHALRCEILPCLQANSGHTKALPSPIARAGVWPRLQNLKQDLTLGLVSAAASRTHNAGSKQTSQKAMKGM